MSDTARDYQTIETSLSEGLDEFFDVVATSADTVATVADIGATSSDKGNWVTVPQASSTLQKSERTIQRYAKSGKLLSRTDNSGRLMILLSTSADIVATSADNKLGLSPSDDTVATVADIVATSADNKLGLSPSDDTVATVADIVATSPTSSDTERLWELLKEKDAKIEALLMRNGYLQAQAESAQETIKLLTDSQHKGGWWAKFSSWFFKGK